MLVVCWCRVVCCGYGCGYLFYYLGNVGVDFVMCLGVLGVFLVNWCVCWWVFDLVVKVCVVLCSWFCWGWLFVLLFGVFCWWCWLVVLYGGWWVCVWIWRLDVVWVCCCGGIVCLGYVWYVRCNLLGCSLLSSRIGSGCFCSWCLGCCLCLWYLELFLVDVVLCSSGLFCVYLFWCFGYWWFVSLGGNVVCVCSWVCWCVGNVLLFWLVVVYWDWIWIFCCWCFVSCFCWCLLNVFVN